MSVEEIRKARCVVLFARSPDREGLLKGLPEASPLFAFARRRIAEAVRQLPGVDLVLIGGGALPGCSHVLPQRGRDFGERLTNAFVDVAGLGYGEIVAVPSDVPSLDAARLAEAFEGLDAGALVLGPSPDGGVYLIGVAGNSSGFSSLLDSVRWQTPRVSQDLTRGAEARDLPTVLLSPLNDVDDRRDLVRLAARLDLDTLLRDLLASILASPSRDCRDVSGRTIPSAGPTAAPRGPPAGQALAA